MKQNFNTALKYVLVDEGGNDDDPDDHGGRTSRGITQKEYNSWCSLNNKSSKDVWKATQSDIETIYHDQYWDPYCDDLPPGVDYLFFDTSVNAGRSQAVRSFQKALGINADGMMGQVTRAAIINADPKQLINDVSEVRRNFYRHLRQFPKYGNGWLHRVDHCERGALAILNKTPYKKPVPSVPSPKADENDHQKPTVSPETSGTTAVATGGLLDMLHEFKDSIEQYADITYIKYALIAIAVASFGYAIWGVYKRSKAQQAM